MEIVKNRNGQDRVFQRVSHTRVRVMGDSAFCRKSADDKGNLTMFDFEGGPAFNIGSKFRFEKMEWKIKGIVQENIDKAGFVSVLLEVSPIY
jgi:hypothetical protein